MINLQKRRDYEASLNNILHKASLEEWVERVVITLLNDILDDLGKWPELSAEDTPKFSRTKLQTIYGLSAPSVPDGTITYQQADLKTATLQPRALIEVKNLATNQKEYVFIGKGAGKVIEKLKDELKNESDIKNIIKEILYNGSEGKCAELKNKWKVKVLPINKTYGASPIEIMNPSETLVATLYQLDTYLLECYLYSEIKGVIWTNGLCWKIWRKDDSGNIDSGLADPPIILDPSRHGNVQIDPIKFRDLTNELISFLSTL